MTFLFNLINENKPTEYSFLTNFPKQLSSGLKITNYLFAFSTIIFTINNDAASYTGCGSYIWLQLCIYASRGRSDFLSFKRHDLASCHFEQPEQVEGNSSTALLILWTPPTPTITRSDVNWSENGRTVMCILTAEVEVTVRPTHVSWILEHL